MQYFAKIPSRRKFEFYSSYIPTACKQIRHLSLIFKDLMAISKISKLKVFEIFLLLRN